MKRILIASAAVLAFTASAVAQDAAAEMTCSDYLAMDEATRAKTADILTTSLSESQATSAASGDAVAGKMTQEQIIAKANEGCAANADAKVIDVLKM